MKKHLKLFLSLWIAWIHLFQGCASSPQKVHNEYSAFISAKPKVVLTATPENYFKEIQLDYWLSFLGIKLGKHKRYESDLLKKNEAFSDALLLTAEAILREAGHQVQEDMKQATSTITIKHFKVTEFQYTYKKHWFCLENQNSCLVTENQFEVESNICIQSRGETFCRNSHQRSSKDWIDQLALEIRFLGNKCDKCSIENED